MDGDGPWGAVGAACARGRTTGRPCAPENAPGVLTGFSGTMGVMGAAGRIGRFGTGARRGMRPGGRGERGELGRSIPPGHGK